MNIKLKTLIPALMGIALPVVTMVATASPVKALSFHFVSEFDGSNSSGTFNSPRGVAVDSSGKVYVADTGNNSIKVFSNNTGTFLSEFDGTGSSGTFSFPYGVAVDSSGNVYVADTNHNSIKVFSNNTGTFLSEFDGSSSSGTFINPYGVAVDSSGKVYVTDTDNNKIKVFAPDAVVPEVPLTPVSGLLLVSVGGGFIWVMEQRKRNRKKSIISKL